MILRLVVMYFFAGATFAGFHAYMCFKIGLIDRMTPRAFSAGLAMAFLAWPIALVSNVLIGTNPETREKYTKWLRRSYYDKDDRFTRPQMPAMCGSLFKPRAGNESEPAGVDFCVKSKGHVGLHGNRHPNMPHDDVTCPCVAKEWATEESYCGGVRVTPCALHGQHNGPCKSAEGEEFVPFQAGP